MQRRWVSVSLLIGGDDLGDSVRIEAVNSANGFDFFAVVLEEDDVRDGGDAEARGERFVLLDIGFDELDVREFGGELRELRAEAAARRAPHSEEIGDDEGAEFDDLLVELGAGGVRLEVDEVFWFRHCGK